MLIRIQPTTLLQICCAIMVDSKVILESIIGADDTSGRFYRHEWVNPIALGMLN